MYVLDDDDDNKFEYEFHISLCDCISFYAIAVPTTLPDSSTRFIKKSRVVFAQKWWRMYQQNRARTQTKQQQSRRSVQHQPPTPLQNEWKTTEKNDVSECHMQRYILYTEPTLLTSLVRVSSFAFTFGMSYACVMVSRGCLWNVMLVMRREYGPFIRLMFFEWLKLNL